MDGRVAIISMVPLCCRLTRYAVWRQLNMCGVDVSTRQATIGSGSMNTYAAHAHTGSPCVLDVDIIVYTSLAPFPLLAIEDENQSNEY